MLWWWAYIARYAQRRQQLLRQQLKLLSPPPQPSILAGSAIPIAGSNGDDSCNPKNKGSSGRNKIPRSSPAFRGCNVGLVCFILWTVVGTIFYAFDKGQNGEHEKLGFLNGFYMAVNVGFSIGLGPPIEGYAPNLWFSSFYIVVGAVLITLALVYAAERVECPAGAQQLRRGPANNTEIQILVRCRRYVAANWKMLSAITLWVVSLSIMVLYSMLCFEDQGIDKTNSHSSNGRRWTFSEAQYFAISLSSTAGSYSLPQDSPSWMYAITAVIAVLGVPIMAMAISSIVLLVLKDTMSGEYGGDDEKKQQYFRQVLATFAPESVMDRQLETLAGCAGDIETTVSREQYTLVCAMRLGMVDREFVRLAFEAYDGHLRQHIGRQCPRRQLLRASTGEPSENGGDDENAVNDDCEMGDDNDETTSSAATDLTSAASSSSMTSSNTAQVC